MSLSLTAARAIVGSIGFPSKMPSRQCHAKIGHQHLQLGQRCIILYRVGSKRNNPNISRYIAQGRNTAIDRRAIWRAFEIIHLKRSAKQRADVRDYNISERKREWHPVSFSSCASIRPEGLNFPLSRSLEQDCISVFSSGFQPLRVSPIFASSASPQDISTTCRIKQYEFTNRFLCLAIYANSGCVGNSSLSPRSGSLFSGKYTLRHGRRVSLR